jgi:uncharacterized protein involved in exopolysaccharide biosynthesis
VASLRPRTITEYLAIPLERKALMIFVFILVLASIAIAIHRVPDSYESRATIVVANGAIDRQERDAQVVLASSQMTSQSNLEPAVRELNLYPATTSADSAVAALNKGIKLETKTNGSTGEIERFNVSYRARTPEMAQAVLTRVIDVFNKANDNMAKRSNDRSNALTTDLDNVRLEAAGVEERLREAYLAQMGATSRREIAGISHSESVAMRSQRTQISATVDELKDKQYALQMQKKNLETQIGEQEKSLKFSVPADGARANSSYGVLLVREAELEAQLKGYDGQYTDKNPKVVQARNELGEIKKKLSALESSQGGAAIEQSNMPGAAELRGLRRELSRTNIDLEVVNRELARRSQQLTTLPASPKGSGAIASVVPAAPVGSSGSPLGEVEQLRARYNSLLNKQTNLEQKLAANDAEPGLFRIVDGPSLPQFPVAPSRYVWLLVAALAAFAMAFIVAMGFEFKKLFRLTDELDIHHYLGAPVVGFIPETLTPAEHGNRRTLLATRRIAYLIAGVLLVPVLVLVLNNLSVFQMIANR